MARPPIEIDPITRGDRDFIELGLAFDWGGVTQWSTRGLVDASRLSGLLARRDGRPVGYLLVSGPAHGITEIVVLHAIERRIGVGTRLVRAILDAHIDAPVWPVVACTTPDNWPAMAFWQRLGFDLHDVHRGALRELRDERPDVPLIASNGHPMEDMVEFRWVSPRARHLR